MAFMHVDVRRKFHHQCLIANKIQFAFFVRDYFFQLIAFGIHLSKTFQLYNFNTRLDGDIFARLTATYITAIAVQLPVN